MNDFELMKAIIEKGYCAEDVYFSPDESEIGIEHGITIYFHPSGDIDTIVPHNGAIEED